MSKESNPQAEVIREEQISERSLGAALIQAAEVIGGGAVVGTTTGVAGALTHQWLQGDKTAESELATKQVELPPGVHLDE